MDIMDLSTIKPYQSQMQNSLWHHDYYPFLPELEPEETLEIGAFTGPGVIRTIHLTLLLEGAERDVLLRNVFMKITYNSNTFASVYVPVGDFFCDSFGGESISYASIVMAKRPTHSWFSYLPMPFEKSVSIELVNTTKYKVTGYGYITAESLPGWNLESGYFHSRWIDATVKLPYDRIPLLKTEGKGHFLGCHLTAESKCRHFLGTYGVCEGNDEFFVDGSREPVCNYLGTEDFFGFSWNWQKLWCDDYSGTTFLSDEGDVMRLACYRFLLNDPVRFSRSLEARINYEYELKNFPLLKAKIDDNGIVRYCIAVYWYQDHPVDQLKV